MNRKGVISFGDASLHVREDPQASVMGEWERQFKKDVFLRMAQQLRRLGWRTEVPADMIEQYSRGFAENHRYCEKGELKGLLGLAGRCIEFEVWQGVNTPNRPDHGGRYEPSKEAVMPYLLRLEMERTRRRLSKYLCNVFDGYEFRSHRNDGRMEKRGPGALTAMEWVKGVWRSSWHFQGDTSTYKISDYNRGSADGLQVEHGQRVYFADRKGRMCTGIAYYNINNMWWVVTGKYGVTNEASHHLYVEQPPDLRRKRNERLRRCRLESELAKAIKAMNFQRAEVLKGILFPNADQLYLIWHKKHSAWFAPNFNGYRDNVLDAGKYTFEELGGYTEETEVTKPVLMAGAA